MKKIIITSLMVVMLLVNLMPVTLVYANSPAVTITITADKQEVAPGEEINYTIKCKATDVVSSITMELDIPEDLILIEAKVNEETKNKLNLFDYSIENSIITMMHQSAFSIDDTIATFKCKAKDVATGEYTVKVKGVEVTDENIDPIAESEYTITPSTTKIKAAVTGISLNSTQEQINAGETVTLTPTVIPADASNKKVIWSSSNEDVATVNAGVVTGVKTGTATITVTTEEGNYSANCQITVVCAHTNKTTHPAVSSTCLVAGNAEYETCDACGEVTSGSDAKLPLADHNYGTLIPQVAETHTNTQLIDGKKAHYKCSVCDKYFDENKVEVTEDQLVIKATHTYGDWQSDTSDHWKECGCGNIVEQEAHKGGVANCQEKAKCEVCHAEYGNVDPTNHKNTEVRDYIAETCTTDGYTGDIYCVDCNVKVKEGTTIPAGHKGGKATCIQKAKCEVCGIEYGEIDPDYHVNVEIRDEVKATTEKEGYTGDKYCADCDTLLEKGSIIPVLEETKEVLAMKENANGPKTGDNSNILLWMSVFVISGIGFITTLKCNPKRKMARHSK